MEDIVSEINELAREKEDKAKLKELKQYSSSLLPFSLFPCLFFLSRKELVPFTSSSSFFFFLFFSFLLFCFLNRKIDLSGSKEEIDLCSETRYSR